MKNIIITVITTILLIGCAGTGNLAELPKDENGNVEYQGVVQLDKSKKEIHESAREWSAINFKSAQDVIQLDDKEDGNLIVKGNFDVTAGIWAYTIGFTLQVESKDGRYRYSMNQFAWLRPGFGEIPLKSARFSGNPDIDGKIKDIIESLKSGISSDEKSDW